MKTIHEYKPQINKRREARYTSASDHIERLTPPHKGMISLLGKGIRGELVEQEVNDECRMKNDELRGWWNSKLMMD